MCAALLVGFWWIVPLVGFLVCLGFMLLAFRSGRAAGGGCMCMGGHRSMGSDGSVQAGTTGLPRG